jgi:hypothetical protein
MPTSRRAFDRWHCHEPSTWSFHVYLQYNNELIRIQTAHNLARAKVYSVLGASGAAWEDRAEDRLGRADKFVSLFPTLKGWSEAYNLFENWVNLSSALTAASNLETYMASAISLAIESDPGLLIGARRVIDGAALLKAGLKPTLDIDLHVEACTKGDWSSRISYFIKLFGEAPIGLTAAHSDLEALRRIRNNFGHAFGRDIDEARRNGVKEIIAMERLTRERSNRLKSVATRAAKAIDRFLLERHIGDFEVVRMCAIHLHKEGDSRALRSRARHLKHAIGSVGAVSRGLAYCEGLVEYWDKLPEGGVV